MESFIKLINSTRNQDKKKCFQELHELVLKLKSTSENGIIITETKGRGQTEMLTTVLSEDGIIDDCRQDDVELRIDCLLDLGRLNNRHQDLRENRMDESDEENDVTAVPIDEIGRICARHFVTFGTQLIAASCAGDVPWMKALLRLGANPNERVISDTRFISDARFEPLTPFVGALLFAPKGKRLEALKLLVANRSEETVRDVLKHYPLTDILENHDVGMLRWVIKHSKIDTAFMLYRSAHQSDYEAMKVISQILMVLHYFSVYKNEN